MPTSTPAPYSVDEVARLDAEVITRTRSALLFGAVTRTAVRDWLAQHRGLQRLSTGRWRRACLAAGATEVNAHSATWTPEPPARATQAKPPPPVARCGKRPPVPESVPAKATLYDGPSGRVLVFGACWDSVAIRELRSGAPEQRIPYAEWPAYLATLKIPRARD